jgi:hypothetical protein
MLDDDDFEIEEDVSILANTEDFEASVHGDHDDGGEGGEGLMHPADDAAAAMYAKMYAVLDDADAPPSAASASPRPSSAASVESDYAGPGGDAWRTPLRDSERGATPVRDATLDLPAGVMSLPPLAGAAPSPSGGKGGGEDPLADRVSALRDFLSRQVLARVRPPRIPPPWRRWRGVAPQRLAALTPPPPRHLPAAPRRTDPPRPQLGAGLMSEVYGRLRAGEAGAGGGADDGEASRAVGTLLEAAGQDASILNLMHRLIFCEDQMRPDGGGAGW